MIEHYLQQHAEGQPNETFLRDEAGSVTFQEAERQVRGLATSLHHDLRIRCGDAVYLYAKDSVRLILTLLAAQRCGARILVLNRQYGADDLRRITKQLPLGPLITDSQPLTFWPASCVSLSQITMRRTSAPAAAGGDGGIVILTTGTTGTPKAAHYTWNRLMAQVRTGAVPHLRRWALLYPLNHFAGLQVLLHALKNGLSLAIPKTRQFPDVLRCFEESYVDSASATPTFWRMFTGRLTAKDASRLKLRQITLGGEPITADVFYRLRELFPAARITQIFATTELGSCFAISDGQPGFPSEFLTAPAGNVALKMEDGQLYVRSNLGMEGYIDGTPAPKTNDGWVATGDLVELRGNRVYFLGRKGEVINVGGVKVFPPTVEDHIRSVPGVRDVRVYGKANPVTGQIVAADVEVAGTVVPEAVLTAIRQHCRSRLSRYEQPRELSVVAQLSRSNEKLIRHGAATVADAGAQL